MTPTMTLEEGRSIADLSWAMSAALGELLELEANKYALGHWLYGAYRGALVGHASCPFSLRMSTDLPTTIRDAQAAVRRARDAATLADDRFVASMPPRVHVVRIRDTFGNEGFGPVDMPGAPLAARGLSLLLADYLTSPGRYVEHTLAAS